MLKAALKRALFPYVKACGQESFLLQMPDRARVLDVGCGNSPGRAKSLRPDIYYVGVDVDVCTAQRQEYADSRETIADEYHLTSPDDFATALTKLGPARFDAVVSAHNIEHTDKPFDVLKAICGVLKPGGRLYLSFPSQRSLTLPHREGTLNFYDDKTHVWPPQFDEIIACLAQNGIQLNHRIRQYHPPVLFLIGAITEPYAATKGKVGPFGGTWALYGFESVIWGTKTVAVESEIVAATIGDISNGPCKHNHADL